MVLALFKWYLLPVMLVVMRLRRSLGTFFEVAGYGVAAFKYLRELGK
jgi:hypothetical protein